MVLDDHTLPKRVDTHDHGVIACAQIEEFRLTPSAVGQEVRAVDIVVVRQGVGIAPSMI